jgi:N-acetylglutamate synthase-like GNAT family acetyltransferase
MLGTHPRHEHQGHGSRLIQWGKEIAGDQWAITAYAERPAVEFFEHRGFEILYTTEVRRSRDQSRPIAPIEVFALCYEPSGYEHRQDMTFHHPGSGVPFRIDDNHS